MRALPRCRSCKEPITVPWSDEAANSLGLSKEHGPHYPTFCRPRAQQGNRAEAEHPEWAAMRREFFGDAIAAEIEAAPYDD